MLLKQHIILGFIFSLLLLILFPKIQTYGFLLIFLSSFLIDFDHYLIYALKEKSLSLKKAYKWYLAQEIKEKKLVKKGIRKKGYFHIFHTIEFHILLALLSLFSLPFFYILIGFIFHSLADFFDLIKRDRLYKREYFFTRWLLNKNLNQT